MLETTQTLASISNIIKLTERLMHTVKIAVIFAYFGGMGYKIDKADQKLRNYVRD